MLMLFVPSELTFLSGDLNKHTPVSCAMYLIETDRFLIGDVMPYSFILSDY